MSEEQEGLHVDELFAGMTRPAVIMGVTYSFFIINAMITAIIFLATGNPLFLGVGLPLHAVGYLACLREPRTFDIFFVWLNTMNKCRNRSFWGGSTYSEK